MTRALNRRAAKSAAGELPPLRGIIYARASKDAKRRAISVSSQVAAGRRFFKKHNIVVVPVLIDNDMSASRYATHERGDYAEALRLLMTGAANLLWTWESSRATRKLDVFVELRRILVDMGGYWAYDGRIHDMNEPDDRIATAEDAVESEKESERLRKRVWRGVESVPMPVCTTGLSGGGTARFTTRALENRRSRSTR
jgi:site-specific DNA recombinase